MDKFRIPHVKKGIVYAFLCILGAVQKPQSNFSCVGSVLFCQVLHSCLLLLGDKHDDFVVVQNGSPLTYKVVICLDFSHKKLDFVEVNPVEKA